MTELFITGPICSKKNLLKPRKRPGKDGKAFYYDREIKAQLEGIEHELEMQWKGKPLVHPAIVFIWYTQTGRSDRDNKVTTVLDCMVKAGVLKDDSIDACNGEMLIGKAFKAKPGQAGARVFVAPDGDFLGLYLEVRKKVDLENFSFEGIGRYKGGFAL